MGDLSPAAARVRDELRRLGHDGAVVELDASTRTAAEAAAALGCDVAQIAKSLVFRTEPGDRPVLVVASGVNRVDEAAVAALLAGQGGSSEPLRIVRADAGFVRARTGFAIGGVPPIGHAEPPMVVIDRDLLRLGAIWAAAGTPRSVFPLTPDQLVRMTGGVVAAVAETAG